MLDYFYDPDNDDIQQSMKDMGKVGSAVFLTGIQYLVVKHLLCDPKQYSSRVVRDEPALKQFKNDPTVNGHITIINTLCIESAVTTSTATPTRNLLDELHRVSPKRQRRNPLPHDEDEDID